MTAPSRDDDKTTPTLLLTDHGSGELVSRRWRIRVVRGPDAGAELVRDAGTVMIGGQRGNDLVLTDPTVSRYHVELQLLAEGVLVKDLDSSNGTKVRGVRIQSTLLAPGDTFAAGKTHIQIDPEDSEIADAALDQLGQLVTRDSKLQRVLSQLQRVAGTDATVLLRGETGTGKELAARAIHGASARRKAPFIVVDCGAIPPNLQESELFGHVKGAFTGASNDREGAFEAAHGGTIFLDEVGELPLDVQPKLLRALESRTVRRVGSDDHRSVDVRIVTATHRDLAGMVREGTFRQDLYYRIGVVEVVMPPLRSRPADIALLAERLAAELSGGKKRLSDAALRVLADYDWPGNVRELRNVIQRAVLMGEATELGPEDLLPAATADDLGTFHEEKNQLIRDFERRYVTRLLEQHDGNVSQAATAAGLSRPAFYALMKRTGVTVGS